jgi:glycosyltransferase involved in cell wall biosynthesis
LFKSLTTDLFSILKIALLSVFHPFRGGIAQFSSELFVSLAEKHEVKAFSFRRQYPAILFPGKSQYVDDVDEKLHDSEVVLDSVNPLSFRKTAQKINVFEPDVFISNYWMSFFGPSMGSVAKYVSKNTVKIALIHNIIPHEKRFFDSAFNRYFLKQHDAFVVLSEAVKKDLLIIEPNAQILVNPHPTYTHFGEKIEKEEACRKLDLPFNAKIILFFGLIRDYKGLETLIQSMAELDENYHLLIAGECYGSFENYQHQIDTLSLNNRIHLHTHFIADSDVKYYFSAADCCVLPYKNATQSGVIAVANHFHVPCIVSNVGGLQEHVKHLEDGYVVDLKEESLSHAILQTLDENQLQQLKSSLASQNSANTWEQFSQNLIEFIETVKSLKRI